MPRVAGLGELQSEGFSFSSPHLCLFLSKFVYLTLSKFQLFGSLWNASVYVYTSVGWQL